MPRASAAQRAQRLNRARALLQRCPSLSEAVQQLAKTYSISPRQAYRYLERAERLKHPVAVDPPKIAFTVKLPLTLVRKVRAAAARAGLTLSDFVSRALTVMMLDRGRRRG
jgi:predicted DNA-binding transcriptional regulator YafY